MKEKEYKDFKSSAKKGFHKFVKLSSKGMKMYSDKYEKRTGKNPYNIHNKEHFYSWVAIKNED